MIRRERTTALLLLLFLAVRPALAQETDTLDKETAAKVFPRQPYSPYAGHSFPTRVFWGDTHVHTSYSISLQKPWTQIALHVVGR